MTEGPEFERGRREGLRLALAVLSIEEAKWAALLGKSRSWRTNQAREIRYKALLVAQRRIETVLKRLAPKDDAAGRRELSIALDKLGL